MWVDVGVSVCEFVGWCLTHSSLNIFLNLLFVVLNNSDDPTRSALCSPHSVSVGHHSTRYDTKQVHTGHFCLRYDRSALIHT